jgi:hypothetical protein
MWRAKLRLQIDGLIAVNRRNIEDQVAGRELGSGRTNGLRAGNSGKYTNQGQAPKHHFSVYGQLPGALMKLFSQARC